MSVKGVDGRVEVFVGDDDVFAVVAIAGDFIDIGDAAVEGCEDFIGGFSLTVVFFGFDVDAFVEFFAVVAGVAEEAGFRSAGGGGLDEGGDGGAFEEGIVVGGPG